MNLLFITPQMRQEASASLGTTACLPTVSCCSTLGLTCVKFNLQNKDLVPPLTARPLDGRRSLHKCKFQLLTGPTDVYPDHNVKVNHLASGASCLVDTVTLDVANSIAFTSIYNH